MGPRAPQASLQLNSLHFRRLTRVTAGHHSREDILARCQCCRDRVGGLEHLSLVTTKPQEHPRVALWEGDYRAGFCLLYSAANSYRTTHVGVIFLIHLWLIGSEISCVKNNFKTFCHETSHSLVLHFQCVYLRLCTYLVSGTYLLLGTEGSCRTSPLTHPLAARARACMWDMEKQKYTQNSQVTPTFQRKFKSEFRGQGLHPPPFWQVCLLHCSKDQESA